MIATDLKKILAERETGTAVKSAQTLTWQKSVAFDPSLCIETDPAELYRFNTRLYLEPGFLETFKQTPTAFLQDLQLTSEMVSEAALTPILNRKLSEEEQLALLQIIVVTQKSMSSQEALETVLSADGYGLPAVAALALVVVVAIGLWVVVV